MRLIPSAPQSFEGTLMALYQRHAAKVLPEAEEVAYWHTRIVRFCEQEDAVFVVRQVAGTPRGDVLQTFSRQRFKASDNSPGWWMHFVTFNGLRDARFEDMPTHMFQTARLIPSNINKAGWHVAHIYNAKDRNTDWRRWSRADLVRRFVRNVHPCNCFYLPNTDWQRYGDDPQIIGFFAAQYRERYRAVWDDFVTLAGGERLLEGDGSVVYVCPARAMPQTARSCGVAAAYRYSRLCFKADVIEPLRDDDSFEVTTPVGRFRFTKRQFYATFPNIIVSKSYRQSRIYHSSKVPAAALPFKVSDE